MDVNARKLAEVIGAAAKHDCIEKDFRKPVEDHLIQLATNLEIDLEPHTEVTLGSSLRADTIYNRFIVEWERPGFIKPSNKTANNTHTIAQVKDYGDKLIWMTREKPGRIVGCCTDGRYFIFVTKPDHDCYPLRSLLPPVQFFAATNGGRAHRFPATEQSLFVVWLSSLRFEHRRRSCEGRYE